MFRKLFLIMLLLGLVLLPTAFSAQAQDLTETLELEDFGFTMSYPDGWQEFASDDNAFFGVGEDEADFNAPFANVRNQMVYVFPVTIDQLEGLGGDAAERLVSFAESAGFDSIRERDVEELEIANGYPTFVASTTIEDRVGILGEVNSEDQFAFLFIAVARERDAEDLAANFLAMLDSIELGEGGGGSGGGDDFTFDTSDAEPIEYGDTVEGEITEDVTFVVYEFEGSEGDFVTITMIDTSRRDTLDPAVVLLDEDGETLTINDDADSSADLPDTFDSQITEFELPADGTYFIVATRFSGEGDFELTLEEGEGSGGGDDSGSGDLVSISIGDFEMQVEDAEALEYGDTVEGEITEDAPAVLYVFEGQEGDVVTITMIDTSRRDTLDPLLVLADENGDEVTRNDDADSSADLPDTFDSQITEFELPADGVYYVIASRFSGEGDYELTIESN
ncbi:MAG: pre-peptidase C-terminal domain-containing protein [Chloroflexi bacterium]|nr:pre-peptidase C-terminal domain-containing protein [Chloroflexota bacterium]